MQLLLIEDDTQTSDAIATVLRASGHHVDVANSGSSGLRLALTNRYDVAIIDRMLPEGDGLSILKCIRQVGEHLPALMLTAMGSVADRVAGLNGGADDYLVKPFSMIELAARVDALGRRATGASSRLMIGDVVLDRFERTVRRGETLMDLLPREFQLLEMLMLNSPAVVTRTMMLEKVFKFRFDPGTNLIESHISRLRSKLDCGGGETIIHTVRGEGYAARPR